MTYSHVAGAYIGATIAALVLWYLVIGINPFDDDDDET